MLSWNKLLHAILIFYILLDSVCYYFILDFILANISETDSLSILFSLLKSVLYLHCEMFLEAYILFLWSIVLEKSDITALSIAFHSPTPINFYYIHHFYIFRVCNITFCWLFPFLFIFTFSFTYWLAKILCQYPYKELMGKKFHYFLC